MKYSVVHTPFAEYQLADIWLRATSRQDVADASNRIDSQLGQDPEQQGRLRSDGRRSIVLPPLTVTFEFFPDDRLVKVVSVRYTP